MTDASTTENAALRESSMSFADPCVALKKWEDMAFAMEDEFLHRFCHDAWTLDRISWGGECMNFVYILKDGDHIEDSVPISEWIKFMAEFQK